MRSVDVDLAAAAVDAWEQLGVLTKAGLVAQAATIGLLAAALRKPTGRLVDVALVGAIFGLLGLSLVRIFEAEYVICGSIDPPHWCEAASASR